MRSLLFQKETFVQPTFVPEYSDNIGVGNIPETDEILMMAPRWRSHIPGNTIRVTLQI